MYLLDLEKCDLDRGWLSLREVTDCTKDPYAILSHRWSNEEVLFSDIEREGVIEKKGYAKARGAISQARRDGYGYLWIDTCCVDKKSSAELSEAINSMFQWYQQAAVCYVYLRDVRTTNHDDLHSEFRSSVWWTRGWTLQESLAPSKLHFFSHDWRFIGSKGPGVVTSASRQELMTTISSVIGRSRVLALLHECPGHQHGQRNAKKT